MDRLPYLQLFITDFHSETGHLSLAECGAYIRLITLCWQQPRCRVRADEEWILRKVGASDAEAASAVCKVLEEFFVKKQGHWQNADLSTRFKEASEKSAHYISAGRLGGQATARKRHENQSSVASSLPEAKNEQGSSKPEPEPEPTLQREELSRPAFLEKLRRVTGPGAQLAATYDPWPIVKEWFARGASEDLILRVVEKQTKRPRPKPIYSLRALDAEIDAAKKMQAKAPECRVATPMPMPQGRAGDCLREIKATYGEIVASAWFADAEWTEDEVVVADDFCRSKVEDRFGAVLQKHGFKVTSLAAN